MKIKSILLASAFALIAPSFAMAQEVETSANFGAASDYIFRGVSQTGGAGQFFGGIDASAGKFYVGTWASNVDFGSEAGAEVDFYAGFKPSLGPVDFDFGALAYLYPQEGDLNTIEYKAAATYGLPANISLTGSLYYSPEVGKGGPDSLYKEVAISAPLGKEVEGRPFGLSLGASYGSMSITGGDYDNWKLSMTAATEKGFAIEVGYTDTNLKNNDNADGRGYILVKKSF
jgi:uncharacterized protein (TIGR02001 family)